MNSAVFNMLWSTMAYPREPQPERGFSVLGIVLRYYGLPDVTDVLGDIALQELGKDVHAATDLDAMASTAEWLGFNAKMSQPTRLDPAELPVIVKHRGGRFLLVFGLEDGEILAVDPARGLVNQKESAFTREWRREALFISPTPAALSAQKLGELAETIRADCHRQDLIREYRATAVAQGTYGLIFRGETSTGRPLSIKALPSRGVDDSRVKRFLLEVELLRQLQRLDLPGVVKILEIREEKLCYVMEWADGGSFEDLAGTLDTGRAVILFTQIAAALRGLHENGLVHRDLSAGNILLFHGDIAKLSDFGLMFDLGGPQGVKFPRLAGTHNYLSPEQAAGEPLNEKTDIYSLGVILHEVLTGESPFPDTRIPRRFNQPVRPLPSYVPHLLAVIIARCMEPDPSQRPSAAEIEQSLLSFFKDY